MDFLIFLITYPIILLISILPMRLLYVFSDILFIPIYHIFGYRKKVVYNNLKIAYPEKSDKELNELTKKSLHHFLDFIFETIKTFTISKRELKKRFVFENMDLLKEVYLQENRGIIFMGAHYANWEWMGHFSDEVPLYPISVYSPITNKYFDRAIRKSRERLSTKLISKLEIVKKIDELQSKRINGAYGLLSDQRPQLHKTRYWGTFFGQFVPVFTGAEFLAKKHNLIVVNILSTRLKRGYYSGKFEILALNSNDYEDYQITDKYLNSWTEHISKAPEFYLWTHKRFKFLGKYDQWLEQYKNKN